MPIAFLAMLLIELDRLPKFNRTHLLAAFGAAAVLSFGFFAFQATWHAMGPMSLTIFFGPLALLGIFAGAPIGFCFGTATMAYLVFATTTPLTVVIIRMDVGMSNLLLLAVPMFIFLGLLFEVMGLARPMVEFLAKLLGHVRGGLEYVLLGAIFLVSGISGSKIADMAAVAPALLPEMERRGNNPARMVALLAASGVMAETIPPSLVLITVGAVASVSIASLFAGGTLPAAIAAIALAIFVWWQARKTGTTSARASGREILRAFAGSAGAGIAAAIRFFVLDGITTATEVSTIGVFYCLVVGLCTWRNVTWSRLVPILVEVGGAVRCGDVHRRLGHRHGLGADAIRLLARSGAGDGRDRIGGAVHGGVDRGVHRARQSAGGHSGDRAVRPAGLPGGARVAHQRGALRDGGHHRDGHRRVCPALWAGFYASCAIGRVAPNEVMKHIWPYLAVLLVALIVIAAFPIITTILL